MSSLECFIKAQTHISERNPHYTLSFPKNYEIETDPPVSLHGILGEPLLSFTGWGISKLLTTHSKIISYTQTHMHVCV